MNLGSPDSTEHKDVRKYLMEFLMDGRVIDRPYLSRLLLVGGIIVPFRTAKSAHAYSTVWTEEGSPLVVLTRQLQDAVQEKIEEPVEIAMRYGNPGVKQAYDNLVKRVPGLEEVIAIPLYPHYAMSSYETAVIHAQEVYNKGNYPFRLEFIRPFYNDSRYLNALSESIRPYLEQEYDHILFSYHGIPGRHIHRNNKLWLSTCLAKAECVGGPNQEHKNCYRFECYQTTRMVTQQLQIPKNKYSVSFQSRLGKGWLEPFTDVRLAELPKQGIKKLLILCPAFVSDCLETLEEIAVAGRETFMEAGGESYTFIPCMNVQPLWVDAVTSWIEEIKTGDTKMLLKEVVSTL